MIVLLIILWPGKVVKKLEIVSKVCNIYLYIYYGKLFITDGFSNCFRMIVLGLTGNLILRNNLYSLYRHNKLLDYCSAP